MGDQPGAPAPGEVRNPDGRPMRKDSIREQLRVINSLSDKDLAKLEKSPFTQAQRLAIKRVKMAKETDDFRCIDALVDQTDGKQQDKSDSQKIEVTVKLEDRVIEQDD